MNDRDVWDWIAKPLVVLFTICVLGVLRGIWFLGLWLLEKLLGLIYGDAPAKEE